MCDFARHETPFDQTLAARGRTLNTRRLYVGALRRFDRFVGDVPIDQVVPDHLIQYQRHLASRGASWSGFNIHTCALRVFYRDYLGHRDWDYTRIPMQKVGRKLPDVLAREEVDALFQASQTPKHRAIFMAAYGCGLRVSEVLALQPAHIDSTRKVIRVEQGKGRKDRYVMLPEVLLEELRAIWRRYRPKTFLFEGSVPGRHLSRSATERAFRAARRKAGIQKRVSVRSLRHAFATHLLENGDNIRKIQALLGHRSLVTTQVYTHLAKNYVSDTRSPLDGLRKKEDSEQK
jgi:site-specific recombinase XerD